MIARRLIIAFTVVACVHVALLASAADAPGGSKAKAAAALEVKPVQVRLPRYYGRVADAEQKEKLLEIANAHAAAIAKKRAELKALIDARDAALDAALTSKQRQEVAKLKEAAQAKRKASAKADAPAAAKTTAKKA
jgi:hypothetical protein